MSAEVKMARLHAFVEGRVQGVGFRAFVYNAGNRLNITGWVRNTYNDEVEVVAEGSRIHLDQLTAELRRGPYGSHVSNLRLDWEDYTGSFSDFRIAPTT